MGRYHAKSKIKWIKDFSNKKNDVVLLCYENESDPYVAIAIY